VISFPSSLGPAEARSIPLASIFRMKTGAIARIFRVEIRWLRKNRNTALGRCTRQWAIRQSDLHPRLRTEDGAFAPLQRLFAKVEIHLSVPDPLVDRILWKPSLCLKPGILPLRAHL
jgi:hypothetical protein